MSIEAAESALQRRTDYALAYNNICAANITLKEFQKFVTPDDGRKFEVTAHSNKGLDDEIGKGLRHQFPGR